MSHTYLPDKSNNAPWHAWQTIQALFCLTKLIMFNQPRPVLANHIIPHEHSNCYPLQHFSGDSKHICKFLLETYSLPRGQYFVDRYKNRHNRRTGTDQRCFNRNRTGHQARDSNCPARNHKRNECGITGHFGASCKKRDTKNPKEKQKIRNESRKKKVYQVD